MNKSNKKNMKRKVLAVIAAAGEGVRLGLKESKALVMIGGKPMIQWSLEVFNEVPEIDRICVVLPSITMKQKFEQVINPLILKKDVLLVEGAELRQDSVKNGINAAGAAAGDIILVHDAARPFISAELVETVIAEVYKNGIAIPALPLIDTLKRVEGNYITRTLDRDRLKTVQTPQGFIYSYYKKAVAKLNLHKKKYTDESSLFEAMDYRIKWVEGERFNMKITYPEDLLIAESIILLLKGDGDIERLGDGEMGRLGERRKKGSKKW